MICPKCGGSHVDIQREALAETGAVLGGGSTKLGRSYKNKVNGLGIGTQRYRYQTTAICHDWGYFWHPVGQDEENNKKAAKGCLLIIVAVVIVFVLAVSCSTNNKPEEAAKIPVGETDGSDASQNLGQWSVNATPLEDFDIELRDGVVFLITYRGKSEQLHIASQYELNGSTYPVNLDELQLLGNRLESVILADGITSINRGAFNSTGLKRIYLPESLNPIYDDMLAYVYNSLEQIEYGGGEEAWNAAYTHYETPSVDDALEAEDYEALGSALAGKLNDAIGHDFDSTIVPINYNVSISDLK